MPKRIYASRTGVFISTPAGPNPKEHRALKETRGLPPVRAQGWKCLRLNPGHLPPCADPADGIPLESEARSTAEQRGWPNKETALGWRQLGGAGGYRVHTAETVPACDALLAATEVNGVAGPPESGRPAARPRMQVGAHV